MTEMKYEYKMWSNQSVLTDENINHCSAFYFGMHLMLHYDSF